MGLETTYKAECDHKLAADCLEVQMVTRELRPNERLPEFVVPAGWVQFKTGLACPKCAAVING